MGAENYEAEKEMYLYRRNKRLIDAILCGYTAKCKNKVAETKKQSLVEEILEEADEGNHNLNTAIS